MPCAAWKNSQLGSQRRSAQRSTSSSLAHRPSIRTTAQTKCAEAAAAAIRQWFAALGVKATVHVERGPVAQALIGLEQRLRPDVVLFGHTERAHLEFPGYGTTLDQVKNNVGASVLIAHRPTSMRSPSPWTARIQASMRPRRRPNGRPILACR